MSLIETQRSIKTCLAVCQSSVSVFRTRLRIFILSTDALLIFEIQFCYSFYHIINKSRNFEKMAENLFVVGFLMYVCTAR